MPEVIKVQLELQPCLRQRSGVGTYNYEIVRRLRDEPDISFTGNVFNFLGRNDNNEALSGIKVPIRENRLMPYGIYRRLWKFLPVSYEDLFRKDADISVFFNYIVPPRLKGKAVTVVHDVAYLRYPETLEGKTYRFLKEGLDRSIEGSERIITVSEFTKHEIMRLLSVPEEKIEVVYNAPACSDGCDISPSREEESVFDSLKQRFGVRVPYVLFVGSIEPRKNLKRLIKAFKQIKKSEKLSHQLVLAGGKGWRNEEILREAASLSDSGDLVFTGFVSNMEKDVLYRNAELLVFPSLYEGFGIPPLEAMHHGCPVVAADAASIPEVVGDAAYLVDPLEEESIAEGILKVLTDKPLAETLRRRGFEREKLFTWEKSAEQFMEVIRGMAEI